MEVFTVYVRGTFPAGLSTVTLQFGFAEKQNVIPPPMYVSTEKISLRPGTTLIIPLCQVRITASQPVKPAPEDVESIYHTTVPGIVPAVAIKEFKGWGDFDIYSAETGDLKIIYFKALVSDKLIYKVLLLNPLDFHIIGTDNFGNPMFVYTTNRTVYRDYLGATEPVFNLSAVLDLDTGALSKLPIYSYYSATHSSASIIYQFIAEYAYDVSLRYVGSRAILVHFVELVDKKKYMIAWLPAVACGQLDNGFLKCLLVRCGVRVGSLDDLINGVQQFVNGYNVEFLSMTAGGDVIGAVLVEAPLSNLTDIDAALVAGCGNIDVVIVRDGRVVAS
ncbi:MAG TPA: hypothetical protein EYP11_01595, partial [Aquificaceae bacterium]|nr:hypothetical protein [Aquificaceae bacterium]